MPSILIAIPIDYSSVILADKLKLSPSNDVCLYIDSQINDKFQKQALEELKFVGSTVRSTSDKVLLWFIHASFTIFQSGLERVWLCGI